MDWANGFARKTPARELWLVFGLTVCAADAGCARLRTFRNEFKPPPPMLGAEDTTRTDGSGKTAGKGDLYAERMRRSESQAGTALTSARERKPADNSPADASSRSMVVALQPPVPVGPGREPAPAAAKATSPVPATAATSDLPGPIEAPKPASAPRAGRPALAARSRGPVAIANVPSEPTVEAIVASARARLDALTSYQVQLNRQERVGDILLEPEDVLLSIRRNPKAVRLEWVDGPHKGREVIYVADEHGGLMHVNMADSVVRVPRLSMPPDSPLILKSSRHPITEAGLDTVVANLEKTITLSGQGDMSRGRLSYAGLENPGPLERSCHKLVRITPAGETWHVYIDPQTNLPAMVQATDLQGQLLERYIFRHPRTDLPELASADAFDPDRRWGPAKGLLGRLAGSRGSADSTTR
jgi:Protein of unknown function (DUF1571)